MRKSSFLLAHKIVTPGKTGLQGLGCREVNCILDNRIGCNPVYSPGVCCPTSYRCNSPIAKFFPQIDSDLSRIKWGHGINNRKLLNMSLYGKFILFQCPLECFLTNILDIALQVRT